MNETPLRIRMTGEGDTRVIEVTGEVDLNSSPQLRGKMLELIEQYKGRLVVDLAGVNYMDSSGVGTMVELKRRVERQGGSVVLARLQPRVRSVFEITQLDKFFTIVDDLDEARRA
ncbi:MAG: STAS domain-containing protein [Planctomycetes bacterium]|nr:STAS domain-containing protein [Planctomycetota bacterium]